MLCTASYTDIGGRAENEDSTRQLRLGKEQLCLVVADGLGGHGGGAQASAAAADTICREWDGDADPEALKRLVQRGHEAVTAIQTAQCAMMSTVVALEIAGNRAAWAHVGDSRLYHFVDGRLVFQTKDHSASQIAVFMGEITADQIRFHEDRNRVLRALGQDGALTVEAAAEALCPGRHAFLLCSDGFWEYVLENEMASRFDSNTVNQYAAYQDQYVPYVILERTAVYILLDDYALRDGVLDEDRAVECKVTYRGNDYEPDLAVIQTLDGEPVPGRAALPLLPAAEDRDVESGDKVYALGYPGSTDDVNATVAASVERVTMTDGIVSLHTQYIDSNDVMTDSIQHTAQINHGNSGGPLLDSRGAVIAVNTWINGQDLSTGDRMNSYSIEIKYLRDRLDDLRIRYDVYREKSGGISPVMIVAIAAAVAVVAAVAVAVTRKPKTAPIQGPIPGPVPGPTPGPVPGPVQPQARPVIAGDSGLRIQGVAGQFAGRRFAIAGQLRIGRDPARNDLVYPAESQGVSGVHCVLLTDGGRLLVQDLGSTYGTFVGGNRLAANAPVELRVGDRFCLGSEREAFVIARKGEV